jgi:predicted site-specific integrase-resolvase
VSRNLTVWAVRQLIGMVAILGYARVSTPSQDLDAQLAELTSAGVDAEQILTEQLSGSAKTAQLRKARPDKPGLGWQSIPPATSTS